VQYECERAARLVEVQAVEDAALQLAPADEEALDHAGGARSSSRIS
jgi:hypothetical protein